MKGESNEGSAAGIAIGLFCWVFGCVGVEPVRGAVAAGVYGGGSALPAGLVVFDGPAALSSWSKLSNGFCDFLSMVVVD